MPANSHIEIYTCHPIPAPVRIDTAGFEKRFHTSFHDLFRKPLALVCDEGLDEYEKNRFVLNLEGRIRLDSIVKAFVDQL